VGPSFINSSYSMQNDAQEPSDKTRIIAYSISDDVETQIKNALREILRARNLEDLLAPIYTCVKELMLNAVKANFKNIYFENYVPVSNYQNVTAYETALKLFQVEMSRENAKHFGDIAREDDIKAVVEIWTVEDLLHVLVTNPVKMTETELKKVNQKLRDADNCRDLADYFMKHIHDPYREGAGLGLILIMMMLKSLQAPRDSLVILSENNTTTAYLKIPLVGEVPSCA
jgi:hypothetical protein